jgi:hypothetical protein
VLSNKDVFSISTKREGFVTITREVLLLNRSIFVVCTVERSFEDFTGINKLSLMAKIPIKEQLNPKIKLFIPLIGDSIPETALI